MVSAVWSWQLLDRSPDFVPGLGLVILIVGRDRGPDRGHAGDGRAASDAGPRRRPRDRRPAGRADRLHDRHDVDGLLERRSPPGSGRRRGYEPGWLRGRPARGGFGRRRAAAAPTAGVGFGGGAPQGGFGGGIGGFGGGGGSSADTALASYLSREQGQGNLDRGDDLRDAGRLARAVDRRSGHGHGWLQRHRSGAVARPDPGVRRLGPAALRAGRWQWRPGPAAARAADRPPRP